MLNKKVFLQGNESLQVHAKHHMKENSQLKNEKIQLQKEVGKLNTEISSLQANIKVFYIDKQKRSLKGDLRRLKGSLKMNWIIKVLIITLSVSIKKK
ncbi:hypothetical protein AT270_24865 [Bacillus cereus]|nr:hypothetical protein AT270_24865 [Bacillus cereus]MBG9937721.1 hypothetical protein [Bacillus tropicus]OTY55629.1 hypothetical protein BK748_16635 [Bacillus thuringiensis serovar graciosensis]